MNSVEILLLGLTAAGAVWAAARFVATSRHEREARRRKAQGLRNAEAERRALDEACVVCGQPVDPAHDLYDRATSAWWHRGCWRETVK